MRAALKSLFAASVAALWLGCDGRPIDAELPGGPVTASATAPEDVALPPDQGMGGAGAEGTGEVEAAASAQSLIWTRNLLGGVRPVGH